MSMCVSAMSLPITRPPLIIAPVLLHKKVKELLEQRASFHLSYHPSSKQSSFPELFGSEGCQNVKSKGLPSVHFQVPSLSMSFPPIHVRLRPLLFHPSKKYWLIASDVMEAKWPFSCWQKASASFQVFSSALQ